MSASHEHALPTTGNERRLWIALGLTASFMIAEVVAGILTNSLALISDAAHMLTDAAALAIALAAVQIGKRKADSLRTFGYYRFEILAAAFNCLMLFGVAIYILIEAYSRFKNPPEVQTGAMMLVAILGLVVNLISMKLLQSGKDASLNVKGAYLEVWSDMLGSLGVIIGAIIIRYTGWTTVDAIIAVLIGLWVLPRTWVLLKESLNILLEGVPNGMDIAEVRNSIAKVSGVTSVHDLHIWALTSGKPSLTAHVVHDPSSTPEIVREAINAILADRFAVFHTTLQMESVSCRLADEMDTFTAPAKHVGRQAEGHA
ncbi:MULTISPECIES: cation diffusion facilitator family transporter [Comamonadaceae]|uniref:Cation transporter n=1 Tax=Comamonas antarctica TaxID=2743470 RepID=A0A6N1WZ50_9BURK|nr:MULTISPECIES: cation diffusion facilitator family transporter [Comamonadaceae]QKV51928.1 cation transporter [Comamonas antarctica]